MIVAFTGHRPNRGRLPSDAPSQMRVVMRWLHGAYGERLHVISGMAQGWDTLAAKAAVELGVPFTAALPWAGHGGGWPADHRDQLRDLCALGERTVVVCDTPVYRPWVYQKRDEWMVDNSELLISAWDGIRTGGTWNTIRYAMERQRKMVHVYREP